jgi:DNA-binding CsgD family transcriptional regulator
VSTPRDEARAARLTGRRAELGTLDKLVAAIRAGESRVLVVHGEAGIGKTALLEYLAGQAPDCRVARTAGVQSEMELAFAGVHQLCASMLDHVDRLPPPQREALRVAFGLSSGPAPDQFLIGLAVLGLLSEVAAEWPLLCLVDDQQWLDQASAQLLAFVARRLGADAVGVVFGVRQPGPELAGLPELAVGGLPDADARALLDSALSGPLDARVRDQIVAETRGNPLALLELPRGLTPAELAGGFALPGALPLAEGVEESFRRRGAALPPVTRRLLLVAAADPTGDPALVWRAAGQLGVASTAAGAAVEAGLVEFGTRVRFRHPLVRSVAYWSAEPAERRAAHAALAAVTDRALDAERRVWHLAAATQGPDEEVAQELERSAGTARARGGLAAAAAFLERATLLTLDPALRARRALAAARTKFQAGALDAAQELLAVAEVGPLCELDQAGVDVLHAQLAFATNRGSDAPPLHVSAARRLEPIDAGLSRASYLDALTAALFAGRLAGPGGSTLDVARAAAAAPRPPHPPQAPDLLLDGFAALFTDGYATGVPILRRALTAFETYVSPNEELRHLWLACLAALHLWDDAHWELLSRRYIGLARDEGALTELPLALSVRAHMLMFAGDLTTAAALTDEVRAITEAVGSSLAPYGAIALAVLRGRQAEATALIELARKDVTRRGEGVGIGAVERANAMLHNGLGDYHDAVTSAEKVLAYRRDPGSPHWAATELVEAAARCGLMETAAGAHRWLAEITRVCGTDWALGIEARSHALLLDGAEAEQRYQESITRLGRTRIRTDLARVHLLYGEWLRRARRRTEAREQLHTAEAMLAGMGMDGFAERARRELRATGATARKRTAAATAELTPQEVQIARLARDGLSNPEIATRLFISARTVQYHLRKVFAKLGITSRSQLDRVLP